MSPLRQFVSLVILLMTFGIYYQNLQAHKTTDRSNTRDKMETIYVDTRRSSGEVSQNWHRKLCDRFNCFEPLQCELTQNKELSYYVYPPIEFRDAWDNTLIYSSTKMMSSQFLELIKTIVKSPRLTDDPKEACIFVPTIDLSWLSATNLSTVKALFQHLPYWYSVDEQPGTNHLIVSLDSIFDLSDTLKVLDRSMLASSQHDTWTYIPGFDLSIPHLSEISDPETPGVEQVQSPESPRTWLIVNTQYSETSIRQKQGLELLRAGSKSLILGHECRDSDDTSECSDNNQEKFGCRCPPRGESKLRYSFPQILSEAKFVLILNVRSRYLGNSINYLLAESLKRGSIPIVSSDYILPYDDLIDWSDVSLQLTNEEGLDHLLKVLVAIKPSDHQKMSKKAREIWYQHFRTPSQVARNIMQRYDRLVYPQVLLAGNGRQNNNSIDLDL